MPALYKVSNSPFFICQFRDAAGRRVTRSTKQAKLAAARRVADAWEQAARLARSHELTQSASVKILSGLMEATIGEKLERETIAESFARYMEAAGLQGAESTIKRYRPIAKSFLESLANGRTSASVASLTASEVERWHKAELKAGKRAQTANYGLKVVRGILERPRRLGLITHNPAEAVKLFDGAAAARQPFTDEEIRALLAVASPDWRGMILLAAWAGLRLADAASLTWGNVDLDKATLTFRPSKSKRHNPGPLVVALHAEVVAHLKALPRGIAAAPLFPSLHGCKPGSHGGLSNQFAGIMAKAGIDRGAAEPGRGRRRTSAKSFHSLRHSMISRMAEGDVSADVRKAVAGHASDSAHKRYTHLSLAAQRRGIESLPALAG